MSGYLFAAGCVLLACACYGAGRAALPPWRTAAVAVGGLAVSAAQFAIRTSGAAAAAGFVSVCLVFAVLPLLAGRYVAAQRALATELRLDERLRIARDMHDSLGRRLSIASIQAAALEVADLPLPQRDAVARLATAVRASATELHAIVDALREQQPRTRRLAAASDLVSEFREAGAAVSIRSHGKPARLQEQADEAAYRVIEEGLTNAVRHAPGQPVTVTITWQDDVLTVTVTNPANSRYDPGSGLAGLAERLQQAGGCLSHELSAGSFQLRATLPATTPRRISVPRVSGLGLAVGIFLFVILPATILLGLR